MMLKRVLPWLLAAALLLCAFSLAENSEAVPEVTEAPADESPEATEAPKPAKGYVLVTTATQAGWLPLPEEGELSVPVKQVLPDGTEAENVIHLTPDGVYMEDSTCEGHDCIDQGTVTLDNKSDRILGNMIICLPNQVVLELYTPETLQSTFGIVP